jgi:ATP/maltotriose-dependent transcriptional regulator MalT
MSVSVTRELTKDFVEGYTEVHIRCCVASIPAGPNLHTALQLFPKESSFEGIKNNFLRFLRKLFGGKRNTQPQPTSEDADLIQIYTDTEVALQALEQLVREKNLPKRLLVIHGLGGVGKSTLLKMYAYFCHSHRIPVALVASEEAPSPVDVLAKWADDLSHDDVALPVFQRTLTHFRTIQAKVEAEAASSQLASHLGKAAAQTVIGLATSAIPIVGPLVGAVASTSAEAFVDWLHSFLTKPDLELYLDPVKRLTSDFLSDLANVASRQRIVLMADTYEQMTALDDWMRELARRLHENVLLVIAGRTVPDWGRAWQTWMVNAEIVELEEMTPDNLRALVRSYYARIRRGDPDPQQVEAIVQFARGLPLVATTVVQLWVKYGVEDFHAVRPQVVADLVDRLLEGVPQEMRPAFETAAVLRYFNVDALGALLEHGTAEELYTELRRWPFIHPRREGLAVHDTMREMINEALFVRAPERFRRLHEHAAEYYEAQLEKAVGNERERYAMEQLYHRIRADEVSGVQLFRKTAEELIRYGLVNQLRALLNDVNTYLLELENSRLWRKYYQARLLDLERHQPEAVQLYEEIANNEQAEDILRAYALCDWAWRERMSSFEKYEEILERIHNLYPDPDALSEPDIKLGLYMVELGELYKVQGKRSEALAYLERARSLYEKIGDLYWVGFTYNRIKYYYLESGAWNKGLEMQHRGLQEIAKLPGEQQSFIRSELLGGYSTYWMWAGRYLETEQQLREAQGIAEKAERVEQSVYLRRDLALVLGLQGKWQEYSQHITKVIELGHQQDPTFEAVTSGYQGFLALKRGEAAEAEQYLQPFMDMFSQRTNKIWYFPPLLNWLGTLQEIKNDPERAEEFYQERVNLRYLGQWYWYVGALTGLVRIHHVKGDYMAIGSILHDAEALAQQYEYNDQLASLRLTQGHLALDGKITEWGQGFDTALHFYQQALLYALRHNRFLLDEVLSGQPQETPLQCILLYCQKRGEEGKHILQTLHNWWQSSANNIDIPGPGSFSLIPDGISLLEGERLARQQEPGDGSPQRMITEQLGELL